MSIYKKIILSAILTSTLTVIIMVVNTNYMLKSFYHKANLITIRESLKLSRDDLASDYTKLSEKNINSQGIQSAVKIINNNILKLEELDLYKKEFALSLLITGTAAPILIIIIISFIFIFLIRRQLRPLKTLTQAMEHYTHGDSSFFPLEIHGSKELTLIIKAANTMISQIDIHQKTIKAQSSFLGWQQTAKEMVHAIKNILTPARLTTETVIEEAIEKGDEKLLEDMKHIHYTLDSLQKLSQYLKECSNIKVPEPVSIKIMDVVQEAAGLYLNTNFVVDILGKNFTVLADKTMIRLIFDNLFTNAKDAGANKITIVLHENLSIEFTDNGSGIPKEILSKVFSLNYTTKTKGTGLGLFFSKKTMNDMGYSIDISSNSEGTTVRLCFNGNNISN